jgi:hypothetical protein
MFWYIQPSVSTAATLIFLFVKYDGVYRPMPRSSRQRDRGDSMGRFRFDKNQLLVQRSFVSGRVDDVKTEYSQDYVPLHPSLTEILADTKRPESHRTSDKRPRSIPRAKVPLLDLRRWFRTPPR